MKVRELIELLNAIDPEADVFIDDVDTGWHLQIGPEGVRHMAEEDTAHGRVLLSASYYDELNGMEHIARRAGLTDDL